MSVCLSVRLCKKKLFTLQPINVKQKTIKVGKCMHRKMVMDMLDPYLKGNLHKLFQEMIAFIDLQLDNSHKI